MLKTTLLTLAILLSASVALAQRNSPASKAELAEITERGRQLAEYDIAAWHATDAVLAMKPAEGSIARYIAMKTDSGWAVAFGRFNLKFPVSLLRGRRFAVEGVQREQRSLWSRAR